MDSTPIGIAAMGKYVPTTYMTANEVAEITGVPENIVTTKLGFTKKPMADLKDTVSYMSTQAALNALSDANVDAKYLDAVIYFGGEHKDYPVWLAGPKVAHNIGAKNAWSIDISVMCGSFMAALKVVKSLMLTDKRLNRVLLVSGYRNGDFINMKDSSVRFMYNLGAAGSAALLVKNHDKNVILETALRTDGSFSEDVVVPVGGCKNKITEDDVREKRFNLKVVDPVGMKERLERLSLDNFLGVIRDAVNWSGYKDEDIDYLAILHMKRSAHDFILNQLNLSDKNSVYLSEYGHVGQNDQIISIMEGIDRGMIKKGSIVVPTGAGIGYVWAASAIRWG